jgi:hypothetical protein
MRHEDDYDEDEDELDDILTTTKTTTTADLRFFRRVAMHDCKMGGGCVYPHRRRPPAQSQKH